jgi:hypothetical protein
VYQSLTLAQIVAPGPATSYLRLAVAEQLDGRCVFCDFRIVGKPEVK